MLRPLTKLWTAAIASGLFLPGMAIAQFNLPTGCTAYVTVQMKGCRVSHHYTCAGDVEGSKWRVDIDARGPQFVSQIGHQAEWLFSIDLTSSRENVLLPNPKDPADFTELAQSGYDRFDFSQSDSFEGTVNYKGFDRLTGKTVIIDDVPLLETENEIVATDNNGTVLWSAKGNEYIHLEWREFLSGPDRFTDQEGTYLYDSSPIDFIMPGEPGFLGEDPLYECEVTIS